MQSIVSSSSTAELDLAVSDLGPLAWVLDELRKSLDGSAKALKRFVREAEAARGSDLAALDASQLRIARQQLHQAVGALEMVGLARPALLLRAMEGAVQKFVQQPELCGQEAAAKIERASFALTEYLEGVLADKPISPVALFPQYREVQELLKADRIHPADLWPLEWRWIDSGYTPQVAAKAYDAEARATFDTAVLRIMKGQAVESAAPLKDVCLALSVAQTDERQVRMFWLIAAGFFEALSQGLVVDDLYVRRAASRILLQYATLAKGNTAISERLAQDLLFYCSQAVAPRATDAPVLSAIRAAYDLNRFKPVDYELVQFGRFDPALLAQARKRIVSAKEMWSALSAGDLSKFKSVTDQFGLVTDSLLKLHAPSEPLAQALTRAIDSTVRTGQPPAIELAMEVATSVLYLEAVFDDLDPNDPQLVVRTNSLAERLEGVRAGGAPQPLQAWMEDLYRRVSDKQTMGSVVGELRTALGELEKSLDTFFRNPQDKISLQPVPGQLSQMRGVLSVLGLDHASHAVLRMRDTVEEMLDTEIDEERARAAGTFEHLGNNLGALSFLIDMLNYQPVLAKKLFVYDEEKGELKPVMGRTLTDVSAAQSVSVKDEHLASPTAAEVPVASSAQAPEGLTDQLDALAVSAALAEQPGLAQSARDAAQAMAAPGDIGQATAQALKVLAVAAPAPAAVHAPAATVEFVEDDLRDIFLEEAREVVGNAQQALAVLQQQPTDVGQLTILRRAFHTLKGSARMVGLNEFGEAGWAMEQLLNTWLAEQKSADADFLTLNQQSMHGFERWIEAIAAQMPVAWSAHDFAVTAQALRDTGTFIPLVLGELAAPAAPEEVVLVAAFALPELDVAAPDAFANIVLPADEAVADVGMVFDLSLDAHSTAEPAPIAAPVDVLFDLDLDIQAEALVPSEATSPAPAADSAFDFDAIDFDSLAALSQPVLPATEAVALSDADFDLHFADAEPQAVVSAPDDAIEMPVDDVVCIEVVELSDLSDVQELAALDAAFQSAASAPIDAPFTPDALALAPAEQVEIPELESLDAFEALSTTAPVQTDVSTIDHALSSESMDAPQSAEQTLTSDLIVDGDEPVKVIGGLRIGIPLYNVYLNEADEWSRRLVTEVSEWMLEQNEPVRDSTVALAHSLAGSSATVGFTALSAMARAFEDALQQSRAHHRHGAAKYGDLFVEAAEDIRRLLHQFAAGFMKEPNAKVLAQLEALEFSDSAFFTTQDEDSLFPADASADFSSAPPEEVQAPQVVQAAAEPEPTPQPEPVAALVPSFRPGLRSVYTAPVVAAQPEPTQNLLDSDADDGIDAVDAIDQDLFPIFEEEAEELMPQLGGALRQWAARPDNLGARLEVLRALHTLKGSARLAGALRMGEMAHHIETEIEHVGTEAAATQEFDPLVARFDAMQAAFDKLRQADVIAQNVGYQIPAKAPASLSPTAKAVVADASFDTTQLPDTLAASLPDAAVEPVVAYVQPLAAEQAAMVLPETDAHIAAVQAPVQAASATGKVLVPAPQGLAMQAVRQASNASIRVRSQLLDRMVNQAGEVMITRSRLEAELGQLRGSLQDMSGNLNRLREQLRDIELQSETQMQSRLALAKEAQLGFDPLEFDRFTRVQELTRMMAESVNDVATVQRTLQRTVEATEDDLIAQARQTRELQRDLLRTRMVEFEGISDRLYRVVRQASKESGKQVHLDLLGGSIEMDRGMLDRMTPAFEHLLRNCVVHGIEMPDERSAAGKDPVGLITVHLRQDGNDLSVEFSDNGAGLNLPRILAKALSLGLMAPGETLGDDEAANMIFKAGFTTASEVTELAGRGIGMDVVRAEVNALGGRIETSTEAGQGTRFKLVLPLTTAVTQVVMVRADDQSIGAPANVLETVRRISAKELQQAYNNGTLDVAGEAVPFFWAGALLQSSRHSSEVIGKTATVVIFRSAAQRVALHVDEVLGNREVVVKNLGPQLSRLPGLAGMSVLASGAVVLIYNPVALASVYGEQARALSADRAEPHMLEAAGMQTPAQPTSLNVAPQIPLVMVVDDSITVRRVTQRLLQREGYRVSMAADGLQALERLQDELPSVVLSDIEMPRMDGFDLARNIRADERLKHLPIIMITSRIAEKHREHARELGVDHYLGKPYGEEELLALVKAYCAEQALA